MKVMTYCDRLRRQSGELANYACELSREAYMLEEVCAKLSRLEGRGIRQIRQIVQRQADRLRLQRQKVLLMKQALDRIITTYERCEQMVESLGERRRKSGSITFRGREFPNVIRYIDHSGIRFLP
ncbi:MAG TPA: hypothetical protein DF613_09745 [Lachnospiraceae bacterium]|nr:hypothetical protein [Lachnospiraceae bacterium]